jgi:hypothetical protein
VFCTTALFTWKLDATDVSRMAGHAIYRITLDMYRRYRRRPQPRTNSHRITTPGRDEYYILRRERQAQRQAPVPRIPAQAEGKYRDHA